MNICIYGAASPQLDQIYYEKTEELGRLMARRGHGLVFGGGETGLMELRPEVWTQKAVISWELHHGSLMNRGSCISIVRNLS